MRGATADTASDGTRLHEKPRQPAHEKSSACLSCVVLPGLYHGGDLCKGLQVADTVTCF